MLIDPDFGVVLPLKDEAGEMSAAYRLCKTRDKDQEAAESDRLLYVAATRAQDKLILNGAISLSKSNRPSRLSGWLKQLAGPTGLSHQEINHNPDGSRAIKIDLMVGNTPMGCTVYEPNYHLAKAQIEAEDYEKKPQFCAHCGTKVPIEAKFCPSCGSVQ